MAQEQEKVEHNQQEEQRELLNHLDKLDQHFKVDQVLLAVVVDIMVVEEVDLITLSVAVMEQVEVGQVFFTQH